MHNNHFETLTKSFPAISKRLSIVWGDESARAYIYSLLNDSRVPQRQGFPAPVFSALVALLALHDEEYPQFVPDETGIWVVDSKRGSL